MIIFVFTLDEDASDVANLKFVYRYALTGEEGDGTKVVRANVVDEGGSAGQYDIGSVDLDFTAPTVTLSTNLPNYREDDVVTLTVRASETLAQAPTLEVKQNDAVITDFSLLTPKPHKRALMFMSPSPFFGMSMLFRGKPVPTMAVTKFLWPVFKMCWATLARLRPPRLLRWMPQSLPLRK